MLAADNASSGGLRLEGFNLYSYQLIISSHRNKQRQFQF